MGGLGAVGASSIFGLVRRAGSFDTVLPTFVLVSRINLLNSTVTMGTSSAQRLLRDVRQRSAAP